MIHRYDNTIRYAVSTELYGTMIARIGRGESETKYEQSRIPYNSLLGHLLNAQRIYPLDGQVYQVIIKKSD